jgi:hypothetical protein
MEFPHTHALYLTIELGTITEFFYLFSSAMELSNNALAYL